MVAVALLVVLPEQAIVSPSTKAGVAPSRSSDPEAVNVPVTIVCPSVSLMVTVNVLGAVPPNSTRTAEMNPENDVPIDVSARLAAGLPALKVTVFLNRLVWVPMF